MKIVFCGGGSAGHVTPNLALIDKLDNAKLYYVGGNGIEQNLVAPYVQKGKIEEFFVISTVKLRRTITLKNLALPFLIIKSIRQCKKILQELKPDVVFSKGGYVGLPVVIAAKMLKIPTIIHESDKTLGLANKVCSKFATKTLTAFDINKKFTTTGLIIDDKIKNGNRKNGLQTMQFDGKKPILLVIGGSLGAKALNDAILQNKSLSEKFDIFVVTGKGKTMPCDFVHQQEYVINMADVLSAADVCLTRAGSTTLAELTLANVPFVAVPLVKGSRGEQVANAQWFCNNGVGITISEDNLPQKIANAITTTYNNRDCFVRNQKKVMDKIYGTDNVLQIIKQTAKDNKKA